MTKPGGISAGLRALQRIENRLRPTEVGTALAAPLLATVLARVMGG
jgi:hypothetical protein